ncbi:MAG TPA: hypothetical protein VIK27_06375 [Candidatus Aquilonibacter sp.]
MLSMFLVLFIHMLGHTALPGGGTGHVAQPAASVAPSHHTRLHTFDSTGGPVG